jgi:hypothetical protein
MSNIKRANDILSADPSLRELLWDVVHEQLNNGGDRFNGSPKDLHECISRGAYLQSTDDSKLDDFDYQDALIWKYWSEGFMTGFGWSIETISNLFVESYEKGESK